jgi:glutamate-1-semialdehyde 2,1-aminomutase
MDKLELTRTDKFIYENEIKPYLPRRIFDAHTHIQLPRFHPNLEKLLPLTKEPLLNTVDIDTLKLWWRTLFPASQTTGLLLGLPTKGCDMDGINKWLAAQADKQQRFSILVSPETSEAHLERQINDLAPSGLKPYMCFSRLSNYNDSLITDFLPEYQIALADKYNLAITLHVAKPRGMANDDNIRQINDLTAKYPGCKFILAHCGRCFITPNMEYALRYIEKAENLYFDTSAVCDPGVFLNLFNAFSRKKILFGTDLVTAAGFRGTYFRMAMSWDLFCEQDVKRQGGMEVKATFAAYENLCAMLCVAKFSDFSTDDYEDVFYNNAAALFGLD